jgi:hypothetical protein
MRVSRPNAMAWIARRTEKAVARSGNFDGCFALFRPWRSQKPKIERQFKK